MHRRYLSVLTPAALAFICLGSTVATVAQQSNAQSASPEIAFTVSMPKPHTHLLEVEIHVTRGSIGQPPVSELLVMPVWTPGSYLVREFARHVQDFSAIDTAGRPLRWEKINKNSWRVMTNGSNDWRATYRVYANELSVRTNELNSAHAFWNNAALLMYLEGFMNTSSTLRILPPPSWKIATGLPAASGMKDTFRAENFDILYDSPVEVSNFKTLAFEVKGVPHRIVIDGEGNYDPERMRDDVQKIVTAEVELMGGEIPYHDYTFILHLRSTGGGGLEHLNSTALGYPRFGFLSERSQSSNSAAPGAQSVPTYRGFLGLVAHEFFHLWNVKRIRPDALGPFDYTKENYTKLLWVAEGLTDYYAGVALRRAGLISQKDFLDDTARAIQNLQNTPGRLVMTAEEASFDTWIKFYRQDENSINSQISYYEKGAILGLLLDLEIRKRSHDAKSLDDVMRYLYNQFYKKGRNYTPQDFQKVAELMAGSSLDEFFARYVHGREELDYNAALDAAGLRLETVGETSTIRAIEKAYLGADLAQEGERLMVKRIRAGSPAYDQGLNAGDQIVAWNNMRVTKEFFEARLAEQRPGDLVSLTIFRSDDLSTLPIKLGGRVDAPYRIVPVTNPSDQEKRINESWLAGSPAK
ncbi:MAG: PDZ domain-containing protein [Pyrinomonadaceae bacterium]